MPTLHFLCILCILFSAFRVQAIVYLKLNIARMTKDNMVGNWLKVLALGNIPDEGTEDIFADIFLL